MDICQQKRGLPPSLSKTCWTLKDWGKSRIRGQQRFLLAWPRVFLLHRSPLAHFTTSLPKHSWQTIYSQVVMRHFEKQKQRRAMTHLCAFPVPSVVSPILRLKKYAI